MNIISLLKKNAALLVVVLLIGLYIVVSGTTGSCPSCVYITNAIGLPSMVNTGPEVAAATTPDKPLEVGDSIPAGTLYAEDGRAVSLEDLVSGRSTVLVFYRGSWCPFCIRHLSALMDIVPELEKEGIQLVAISPDKPDVMQQKEKARNLSYDLFSDSDMAVTSQFGITFRVEDQLVEKYKNSYNIDIEADSGQTHHLLPHPSVYVVDGQGIIRFSHVNPDYKSRLEPEKILAVAKSALAQ